MAELSKKGIEKGLEKGLTPEQAAWVRAQSPTQYDSSPNPGKQQFSRGMEKLGLEPPTPFMTIGQHRSRGRDYDKDNTLSLAPRPPGF